MKDVVKDAIADQLDALRAAHTEAIISADKRLRDAAKAKEKLEKRPTGVKPRDFILPLVSWKRIKRPFARVQGHRERHSFGFRMTTNVVSGHICLRTAPVASSLADRVTQAYAGAPALPA